MTEGWDPACEDLAEHFLDDPRWLRARRFKPPEVDELRRGLAQHIQDAVEGWFSDLEGGDDDGNPNNHR